MYYWIVSLRCTTVGGFVRSVVFNTVAEEFCLNQTEECRQTSFNMVQDIDYKLVRIPDYITGFHVRSHFQHTCMVPEAYIV